MIRRALATLLRRRHDDLRTALRRKAATIRALEAALDGATLRIAELESERDESAADAALARADVRQLLMRSEELHDASQAAEEKVAELEDLIERMRDDAGPVYESEQQLRDRMRFLEASREWKPWPPEVRDGRLIEVCSIENGELIGRCLRAAMGVPGSRTVEWLWREIGPAYVPSKGDAHG